MVFNAKNRFYPANPRGKLKGTVQSNNWKLSLRQWSSGLWHRVMMW